jgi:hypothetical protein
MTALVDLPLVKNSVLIEAIDFIGSSACGKSYFFSRIRVIAEVNFRKFNLGHVSTPVFPQSLIYTRLQKPPPYRAPCYVSLGHG